MKRSGNAAKVEARRSSPATPRTVGKMSYVAAGSEMIWRGAITPGQWTNPGSRTPPSHTESTRDLL